MVRGSRQLPAAGYQPGSDSAGCVARFEEIAGSTVGFAVGFGWKLVAGSSQLVYNQRLQRLSVRRSCIADGSPPRRVHLTANGSDAVLRRGNEPVRNPVFFESVA